MPVLSKATTLSVRRLLEVGAALDQHAAARGRAERRQDAHRRRDHERAGARDDEQGERPVEPGARTAAPRQRRQDRDQRSRSRRRRRVLRGEAVDDGLHRGALRLRLLDQVDDLGDGVVGGRRGGAHDQRAALRRWSRRRPRRRAPCSTGIDSPVTAAWLTAACAVDDDAVDGQALAGQHPDQVAGTQRRRPAPCALAVAVDQARLGRRQRDQVADGAPRAFQGRRLQQVAEREEEDDQRRPRSTGRWRRRRRRRAS